MSPDGSLKLISQLLDLPLLDSEGAYCGIVDDVEFAGSSAEGFLIKAMLVGPGAYRGRLPDWAVRLIRFVAGDRIVRVAWEEADTVGAVVRLRRPGKELGLGKTEERLARWIPKKGAM